LPFLCSRSARYRSLWRRYGPDAVVANGEAKSSGISGDPQMARMGDLWVMFYFGAFWKPGAFDTFACSVNDALSQSTFYPSLRLNSLI